MRCRLCGGGRLFSVLDLGATPPCEKFLCADELDQPEITYPLHLRLCEKCLLLQIPALITPEDTFTDYAYYSSFSDSWLHHAKTYVEDVIERLGLDDDSFVIEVASNDGYLLQHMVAASVPCLGIEPSVNVGAAARTAGVPTETAFLNKRTASRIRTDYRAADLVVANNVYAHVPDLVDFTRSLRRLMADDGWCSIEVHHAQNLIALGQFDTIYHEHFQYYTLLSAMRALEVADLSVVDVELLSTHGGSMRVWARPTQAADPPTDRVAEVLQAEAVAGLHELDGYHDLRPRAERTRHDLLRFLLDARDAGRSVVGYGAPGKANTLLNYCGIRSDLLQYTVDRNPYKHGRFTPGTRIPIHDTTRIAQDRPDVVMALPWNLEAELTEQLRYIDDWGGRLVFPLPHLHDAVSSGDTPIERQVR
ncbi:class I SAM-dependent methyltransferase [Mycolicibacterium rufum]|uniref:Class I SAM-dependent methyltransferase n=1 Tax=Mycolicibacterium rufum TaxID=318424 RepID=A0A9X3BR50_9MYCO|nr:class I SAM-dependent methyltransferase [Mycolicibacterium rufum]KGI71156.1 SAM-dependent methyltransferase [Mycolicibacterium rufum]MCV7071965.1 class I SAM-dependent methyltransferase [Mycolicibacterium rufum]ULP39725.1 class I SAM-dependent methyltransferase [Mycolicibacterium rufum]